MSIYYTYYSFETNKGIDGLGYIGYRGLKNALTPEEEEYWGTQTSPKNREFKDNPCKDKIILGIFETKEEAIAHEIYLHTLWSVDSNAHFANQAKQTSEGFSSSDPWNKGTKGMQEAWNLGIPRTEEEKENIGAPRRGKQISEKTIEKITNAHIGKKLPEETRNKIGETNSIKQKGKTPWNKNRKTGKNRKEENEFLGEKLNFKNKNLGYFEENITISEMVLKYKNLKKPGLYLLKSQRVYNYKGWVICNDDNQQPS